jgi:hypothetical protein
MFVLATALVLVLVHVLSPSSVKDFIFTSGILVKTVSRSKLMIIAHI